MDIPEDYIYQISAPVNFVGRRFPIFSARLSGLFRSDDAGYTWRSAYASLASPVALPTIAIAMSPDFQHEPHIFAGLNGVILRSFDGGINWLQANLPAPPPAVSCFAISPHYTQDGIIFAGTNEDGVLVSNDRGTNWLAWNFGLLDMQVLCISISPEFSVDETLFAGTVGGLFRSTNGGRAWREVPLPCGFDAVLCVALSPAFYAGGTMYIGTENNGLLVSQDKGKSWHRVESISCDQPVNAIHLSKNPPSSQEILLLHGGILLVSLNGGVSWRSWQKEELNNTNVTAFFVPDNLQEGVFVGLDGGRIIRIKQG